jgi:hypothetical protein
VITGAVRLPEVAHQPRQAQQPAGDDQWMAAQQMGTMVGIQIQRVRQNGCSLLQQTLGDVLQKKNDGLCIRHGMEINETQKKGIPCGHDQKPEGTERLRVVERQIQLSFHLGHKRVPGRLFAGDGPNVAVRRTARILESTLLAIQRQSGEPALLHGAIDAGLQAETIERSTHAHDVDSTVRVHFVPLQHALLKNVQPTRHKRGPTSL